MSSMFRASAMVVVLGALVAWNAGCETKAQSGALIGAGGGAAAGAGIGSISGHAGEGALIGAGVGAIGGYIVGNELDKKDQREREAAYENSRYQAAPAVRAVTKNDVISWTRAGVKDEVIIDRIQRSGTVFRMTAADENQLRDANVSEEVVRAMKDTAR